MRQFDNNNAFGTSVSVKLEEFTKKRFLLVDNGTGDE
jgi:hypothetical protein